jgi:3-hydroxyisobutyrate dehydrogenase-like beta-hydroxyacid dehydrogenase
MTANFESLTPAKSMGMNIPKLVTPLNKGSGANWSLSRSRKSTGKWAEKDMDHVLELAQAAKVPVPLGGLVDQLVKGVNQERMKTLLG